jgi:opacity protein-like surface antigen
MNRRSLSLSVSALALATASFGAASGQPALAAAHTSHFTAAGWTLTLVSGNAAYGSTLTGSIVHNGKSYMMLGDWIPAADAGGDLLRFYGSPFDHVKGLVSVASLYSTCVPNCASSRTFVLHSLAEWSLPGTSKHTIKLKYQ